MAAGSIENRETKDVAVDSKEEYSSFCAGVEKGKLDRTISPESDFYDSVSPLLSTSYDCVSPTSDKVYIYSSDSGLSSTYSDLGDMLVRSCLTIDISTGIVTRENTVTDEDADDDLIERSFHSVLHSAEAMCQAWPEESWKDRSNFSFVSKKREKFAKSKTRHEKYKTVLGGVFRTLFRPEGKVMSRLRETFHEKAVIGEKKINIKDDQLYIHKWKQKKDNKDTSKETESEKYFDNLVNILEKAVLSLDC